MPPQEDCKELKKQAEQIVDAINISHRAYGVVLDQFWGIQLARFEPIDPIDPTFWTSSCEERPDIECNLMAE
tara:strand:- start:18888 stop:19103 length:216 start_codon:yes stop_codon:yes gene_type:complete